MVTGTSVHSNMCPNCAPADEYVKMPLASLSTFAVMNPGPTTAKNSRIRVFQRLRNLIGAVHRSTHQRPLRINVVSEFRDNLRCCGSVNRQHGNGAVPDHVLRDASQQQMG